MKLVYIGLGAVAAASLSAGMILMTLELVRASVGLNMSLKADQVPTGQ